MCTVSGGSYVGALSCFWGCVSQCFIFKVHAGVLCGYSSTYVCVCVCVCLFFFACVPMSLWKAVFGCRPVFATLGSGLLVLQCSAF